MSKFKTYLFISICFYFNLYAQKSKIDERLVGEWSGTEFGIQFEQQAKHWIQIRYKNGKAKTSFKMFVDGNPFEVTESGKWWIENGKFCKQEATSKNIDCYEYSFFR